MKSRRRKSHQREFAIANEAFALVQERGTDFERLVAEESERELSRREFEKAQTELGAIQLESKL